MIKIDLKQTFLILTVCGLLAISPFASADSGDSLKKIHDMRLLAYGMLGDYYMFSGLEGDSRYSREIDAGIKAFEGHLATITANDKSAAKLASLTQSIDLWLKFKELLNVNRSDFMQQGFANARLVTDLSNIAMSLSKSLEETYSDLQRSTEYRVNQWTSVCREMALIIQRLTAEYTARGTSSLGQVMLVNINEGGMDKQSERFASMLKELNAAPDQSKAVAKLLDQVGVKWEFIAKSIKNYNENAVPFIVNTYGDRIAKNLETVGAHYQTQI